MSGDRDPRRRFRLPHPSRERIAAEVDEELRFHLECREAEFRARGMSPSAARDAARQRFGDVASTERYLRAADARRMRRARWLDDAASWWGDLVQAIRTLARAPLFHGAAALTLALGVGAATVVWSVARHLVLAPVSAPNADRLVVLFEVDPSGTMRIAPERQAVDAWRSAIPEIERIETFSSDEVTLRTGDAAESVPARFVSPGLPALFGSTALAGRAFVDGEGRPGTGKVAMLDYGTWQRRFGGRPSIIGEAIIVDNEPVQVIGVMPPSVNLDFFDGTPGTELWIARVGANDAREGQVLALVRPGVPLSRLQQRLTSVQTGADGAAKKDWDFTPRALPISELVDDDLSRTMVLLAGCSGVLLLIASANVSSLLLARATARRREIAVRMALGAGRWRVARALLMESAMLALVAGGVGVALALGALALARGTHPADVPLLATVRLDASALFLALAASLGTAIACGVAPAVLATRGDAHEALQGGRGQSASRLTRRLRALLVGGQFAASTLLLVTALLFARSLGALQQIPPGYRPDGLASISINFPASRYTTTASRGAIIPELLERVRRVGGIEGATIALGTPMLGGIMRAALMREGIEATVVDEGFIPFRGILPDYFAVTGIPVRRGRAPVMARGERQAAIDEAMAAKHWPGVDPVGERFRLSRDGEPYVVTAVVGNVRRPEAHSFGEGQLYLPTGDPELPENVQLVLRAAAGDEMAAIRRATAAVLAFDPFLRLQFARSERGEMDRLLARPRFLSSLLAAFAGVATLLAAVGLFGALAYSVTQRQREIGVRMALGADAGRVARSVAFDAIRIGGIGLALGLATAAGAGRGVARFLFGVRPLDPWSFGVTAVTLGAIAILAAWLPARRAARVAPMEAVRIE